MHDFGGGCFFGSDWVMFHNIALSPNGTQAMFFVSSQWLLVCRMSLNRGRFQCHSAPFSIIRHLPGHSAERRAPAASTSMCGGAFLSTKAATKTATALVADHASAPPGIITATSWDHSGYIYGYIILFVFLSANRFVMVCSQKYADSWQYFCVAFSECSRLF